MSMRPMALGRLRRKAELTSVSLVACLLVLSVNETAARSASGTWEAIQKPAAARGEGLQNLFAASFGDRVVIVSGSSYDISKVKALEFDRSTATWGALTPAPLRWRVGAAYAETADSVFVWGGFSNAELSQHGAEYVAGKGDWRVVPASPIRVRGGSSASWTGDDVLIWGGTRNPFRSVAANSGAAYEPSSGSWTRITRAPIEGRHDHQAVWTGEEMVVWGGYPREVGGVATNFFADGAAFEPVARTWRKIPKAPIRGAEGAFALWTGIEMFVWNGSKAALYDVESNAWRRTGHDPLARGSHVGVWTGTRVLIWGYNFSKREEPASTVAASYDPATNVWEEVPSGPLGLRGGEAATWTGESMFLWGGCCYGRSDNIFRDGAEFVTG